MNDFGFVQTVDRFRQGVVIAVTARPDGANGTDFCEPLRVANRDVLNAAVAVMDQSCQVVTATGPDGHLDGAN